ncbi:MAG: glycosyltransferase family 8 protein [Clostridia bacterium]|nr:glycosyltransferase family 8 protein [Clostridia bacterium]
MNTQNEIPVFFSIDNNYAPFLAVALNSAAANCSADKKFRAIILHQELTRENMDKLSAFARDNFSVEFVEMKSGLESITDMMSNRLRCDYFTLTIYFRLFIPAMFPQYDKGIYIDSDVVVTGDLAELFNTDIGDNLIGACSDKSIVDVPPLVNYVENAVGVKIDRYINSGVLLMNLKKLRELNFDAHFLKLLNTYHFDCIAPDQDYLNAMCRDRIYYLDESWDAMPNDNHPPVDKPNIIHYNLFAKPWCYDNIQYEDYFWQYAKTSGYYEEITEYKNNYGEEQKKSDSDCLELLVRRGDEIPSQEITFKKAAVSTGEIRI